MTHALKTEPKWFEQVELGNKTFEVRKFDRPFNVGDKLLLQEYDPGDKGYTGKECTRSIVFMMDNPNFVKKGFVILGIKEIEFT